MNPRVSLAKIGAVVCSIVLVSGYVYYRGGGGGSLFPSSKSGRISRDVPEQHETPPSTSPAQLELMSSSKSLSPIVKPRERPPSDAVTVMPGSKSSAVFTSTDRTDTDPPPSSQPSSASQPPSTQP
jgi:hypothetical protein